MTSTKSSVKGRPRNIQTWSPPICWSSPATIKLGEPRSCIAKMDFNSTMPAHYPIDWNTVATWVAVVVLAFLVLRQSVCGMSGKRKPQFRQRFWQVRLVLSAAPTCRSSASFPMDLVAISARMSARAASKRSLSSRKLLSQKAVTRPMATCCDDRRCYSAVAVQTSLLSCGKAGKTRIFEPIRGHLGNAG